MQTKHIHKIKIGVLTVMMFSQYFKFKEPKTANLFLHQLITEQNNKK